MTDSGRALYQVRGEPGRRRTPARSEGAEKPRKEREVSLGDVGESGLGELAETDAGLRGAGGGRRDSVWRSVGRARRGRGVRHRRAQGTRRPTVLRQRRPCQGDA